MASFRLGDYEFSVACASPETGDAIERLFAACRVDVLAASTDVYELRPVDGRDGGFELRVGGKRAAHGPLGAALDRLVWHASSRAFDSGRLLFVHAGVAALDGVAVVLPAPPDHGKSTTVAALVRSGFDFLSDEAAALDPADGRVHPFPRPLMLSRTSLDALPGFRWPPGDRGEPDGAREYRMTPDDLRLGAMGSAGRIGFVVAPDFRSGADTRLEPMRRPEALRLLVEQSFNLTRFGGAGFRLLAEVVRGAECYRLTIGDLSTAVRAVWGLVERPGTRVDARDP